jgi:triacylglycerol lipase
MTTRVTTQPNTSSAVRSTSKASDVSVSKDSRFSNDFKTWLNANGYGKYDFAKGNVPAFGGKAKAGEKVTKEPVIFIHGNSDSAAGWKGSIETFSKNGYKPSEMYAMTWGPMDPMKSGQQYHSEKNLEEVRAFIQAVKEYTGAEKVDVVGHSMGVTLARKAILGGYATDAADGGQYYIGPSLTASVDTFVGIAGANRGLTSCYQTGGTTPTCAATNGLYPGYWNGFGVSGRSAYLDNLYSSSGYEGAFRYSIWSTVDEIIGYGDVVYYDYTSRIPGQTGEKTYSSAPYGHFGLKDQTQAVQYSMVKNHTIP